MRSAHRRWSKASTCFCRAARPSRGGTGTAVVTTAATGRLRRATRQVAAQRAAEYAEHTRVADRRNTDVVHKERSDRQKRVDSVRKETLARGKMEQAAKQLAATRTKQQMFVTQRLRAQRVTERLRSHNPYAQTVGRVPGEL